MSRLLVCTGKGVHDPPGRWTLTAAAAGSVGAGTVRSVGAETRC